MPGSVGRSVRPCAGCRSPGRRPTITLRPLYSRTRGYCLIASSAIASEWPPRSTVTPPFAETVASSRFIGGVPMNPATKRFSGRSYRRCGASTCCRMPLLITATRCAHRHRLDLVVRHVDGRDAELALELRDVGAHLHAQLRVEVRERLVHQEHLRLPHDRAAHRDPLALAARQLLGAPVEVRRQVEHLRGPGHALVDDRSCRSCAGAARRRCSRRRSGAGRARSSGRPSRCRAPSATRR